MLVSTSALGAKGLSMSSAPLRVRALFVVTCPKWPSWLMVSALHAYLLLQKIMFPTVRLAILHFAYI